jgi:hypothetical protein
MLKQDIFYCEIKKLNDKINKFIEDDKINFDYQLMDSLKYIENQLKKEYHKEGAGGFDFLVIIKKEKLIDLYMKEFVTELDPEIDYVPSKEEVIKDFEEANWSDSDYYVLTGEVYNMYTRIELDFNVFWNFDDVKVPAEIFNIDWQYQLILKPKILQDYNIQKIYLVR